MSHLDTEGKSHAEKYPKPQWLRDWLGEETPRENRRRLQAKEFPLWDVRATVKNIVDGDTLDAKIVLVQGDNKQIGRLEGTERIRLLGYNAPERYQSGGTEATAALAELVPIGSDIYMVKYEDRRSFNRVLAWMYADASGPELLDIAAAMIAGGHGVEA